MRTIAIILSDTASRHHNPYRLHRQLAFRSLVVAMLLVSAVVARGETKGAAAAKLDAASFVNPPSEYRPVDCWWWEAGNLTEERLRWQLEEMHAKGVGGTWLYPRFGAVAATKLRTGVLDRWLVGFRSLRSR